MGRGCTDASRFSDPVPVIGLYIGAATLVCLAFVVSDIKSAYDRRHRWLPCRLFSLNSMTLALLGIVAKLSVDLTSPMPSVHDQLCKFTSTAMIPMAMGFFMPSIGINKDSDCLANMVALSIFVVTVVVNIVMQMFTGVIFVFISEYLILVFIMVGKLIMLWFLARTIKQQKRAFVDRQKDLIQKGDQGLSQRLKMCYLYGFNSNPQFVPCKDPHSANIGFLSVLMLAVLLEATIRSTIINDVTYCGGDSDYGFSVWMIVVSQIATVMIGSSATIFRWLSMVTKMRGGWLQKIKLKDQTYANPVLQTTERDIWKELCEISLQTGQFIMIMAVLVPATAVNQTIKIVCSCCLKNYVDSRGNVEDEYKDISYGEIGLDEWTFWKGLDEMKKSTDVSEEETPIRLCELLANRPPSQKLQTLDLKDQVYLEEGIDVSVLTMTLLVRIASVAVPVNFSSFLSQAFGEAYEILHFINDRINFASIKNKDKSKLAKHLWKGQDFHLLLPTIFKKSGTENSESLSDIERASLILRELKYALPVDALWDEVGKITDFLNRQTYSSVGDLYGYIEQLVVDMMHLFLSQLPVVVYDEVKESPPEEYEERVKVCLKLIWKIKAMEPLIEWAFPADSDISCLIAPPAPAVKEQNAELEKTNSSMNARDHDVIVPVQ